MLLQMRSKCSQLCSNSTICQELLNVSCVRQLWLYCSKNTVFDSSCLPSVYTASWPGHAWPWDNVWGVFRQVWPKICVLRDRARTVFANCTACRADPEHDLCLDHGMLFKYWTVQKCSVVSNQTKSPSTPVSCLWQRQVEVGSGECNTSSQKYFRILEQITLQQLSQMWDLFIERICPVISTSPSSRDLHNTRLVLFKTVAGRFFLTSSGWLCNRSALCVIL